jgi:Na+-transporting NADH:ubiquinone oxidoreductase subunit NqrC
MLITMTMNTQLFIIVVVSLTTGQLITEYLRSVPIYASTRTLDNHHSMLTLDHKDDVPSEDTLGNDSASDKILGYTDDIENNDFVISNIHSEDENEDDEDEQGRNSTNIEIDEKQGLVING